jgi:hypothetical protein
VNAIRVVIIGFIVLETTNVIALYFFPGSKYANSVGIFKAWERSKTEPEMHDFVKYLVNWVAGTKVIFLLLLIVILVIADDRGLFYTGIAMAISISLFFWRLYPLIRQMDRGDELRPHNYSTILGLMISVFAAVFLVALVISGTG